MDNFPFRTKPYQHQLDAWQLSKDREYYALFMDLGTGKSKVLLDTSAYLKLENKIDAQVVIVPKGVQTAWVEEQVPTHLACEDNVTAYWSASPRSEERDALKDLLEAPGKHMRTLVMNCEGLTSMDAKATDYLEKFLDKRRCLLAIDESTVVKSGAAHRTKVLTRLAKLAPYRRIMSGNPIPNGPMDLYSQAEFLKKGLLGFSSFYGYRNRFAIMHDMRFGNRAFKKIVGYRDEEQLQAIMRKFAFVIRKADCLDLPEKIYQVVDVEMLPDQKRAYNTMLQEAFVQLESGAVAGADMVMTQLLRLEQIACGFLQTDQGLVEFEGKNPKIDAMLEQIEQAPGKVIIWCSFRRNIEQAVTALSEKYGKTSVVTFYGDTHKDDRGVATRQFQDPASGVRFMVANPQSGKFGNTWTAGTTVIYVSNSYNLEDRQQSEDRSHRIGQTQSVVYIDLRVRNTVDDRILKILKAKKKLTDQIVSSNWKWLLGERAT